VNGGNHMMEKVDLYSSSKGDKMKL